MRRLLTRFLRALALGLAVTANLTAQSRPDPLHGLDAYIEKAMHDWQVPGLAIAIVKNDSVVYAKGFGVRELGKPGRVDENTIFAVASNTKSLVDMCQGWEVPAVLRPPLSRCPARGGVGAPRTSPGNQGDGD